MTGDERVKPRGGGSREDVDGGYTIVLGEERVASFFEAGDFSSASELGHFTDIGTRIDARVREGGARSLLALSVGEKALSRDFAALQIAHVLSKLGRSVLIVDCDFMHPGLSGLVENVEAHGFLDLLLYGSSLKSVAHPIGIDGVSVAGPGSFPVLRTIPFALKEFDKIRDYLKTKHDVVIYCATLRTEDGAINPLCSLVDGIILCCRLEQMDEGELQRNLKELGAAGAPTVDVVCLCGEKETAAVPRLAKEKPAPPGEIPETVPPPGREAARPETPQPGRARPAAVLEKTVEAEAGVERAKPRFSVARVLLVCGAALIVVFIVWWFAVNRAVRETTPVHPETAAVVGEETTSTSTSNPSPSDTAGPGAAGQGAAGAVDTGAVRAEQPAAGTKTATQTAGGSPPASEGTTIPAEAKYTIHVASFNEAFRAENEKKYLDEKGFTARIVEVDLRGEKWLRVLVGAFATREEADTVRVQLLGLKRVGYARVVRLEEALK